jgi:hypothetical protein
LEWWCSLLICIGDNQYILQSHGNTIANIQLSLDKLTVRSLSLLPIVSVLQSVGAPLMCNMARLGFGDFAELEMFPDQFINDQANNLANKGAFWHF